jgi:predicted transcriptional regulator of viral defense system
MSGASKRLYELAEAQAGYFTTKQAQHSGITRQLLRYHVREGNLQRAARGVYRLAQFPAQRFEDVVVACLWAGADAVASHDTALAVYALSDAMPALIHLTLPRTFRGRRPGVRFHYGPLGAAERTLRDGIPATTVERTLRDVATTAEPELVRAAIREALERGLVTRRRLERAAAAEPALRRELDRVLAAS